MASSAEGEMGLGLVHGEEEGALNRSCEHWSSWLSTREWSHVEHVLSRGAMGGGEQCTAGKKEKEWAWRPGRDLNRFLLFAFFFFLF